MSISKVVSANLALLMKHHNIKSTCELARNANIPATTLYNILSDANQFPRIDTLTTLANYFHLSVDNLTHEAAILTHLQQHYPCVPLSQLTSKFLKDINVPANKKVHNANANTSSYVFTAKRHSKKAFAILIDKTTEDFNTGNILIFNPIPLGHKNITFPCWMLIQNEQNKFYVEKVYQIESKLCVREKNIFANNTPSITYLLLEKAYPNHAIIGHACEIHL